MPKKSWEFEILCSERHAVNFKKPNQWLRIDASMIHTEKWSNLSNVARVFWITILSQSCAQGRPRVTFSAKQLVSLLRCKGNNVLKVVRELTETEWLRVVSSPESLSTNGRTDERMHGGVPSTQDASTKTSPQPPKLPTRVSKAVARGCHASFLGEKICEDRLKSVTLTTQQAWLDTYDNEVSWLIQEIKKAHSWSTANPKKAPKDFGKFMTNWLARSFEKRRVTLPSNSRVTHQSPLGEF